MPVHDREVTSCSECWRAFPYHAEGAFESEAGVDHGTFLEQAPDQGHAVGYTSRWVERGQGMIRVWSPVAARLGHFDKTRAQHSAGCPVKFVMVSISSRTEGTRSRSTWEKRRAISSATFRRSRSAWTKSTAERNCAWRKIFGQASGTCALSSLRPPLSVSSSNAAAPSAKRIRLSES